MVCRQNRPSRQNHADRSGFWRSGVFFAVGSGVVFSAEELTVLQVGLASVGPVDDVVGVAP